MPEEANERLAARRRQHRFESGETEYGFQKATNKIVVIRNKDKRAATGAFLGSRQRQPLL